MKDWQLTPIFEKRLEIEADKAKERQAQNALRNQPQNQNVENFPPSQKDKSRDKAADGLGKSGRQLTPEKQAFLLDDLSKQYETGRGTNLKEWNRDERGRVIKPEKDNMSSTGSEENEEVC